MGPPTGPLPAPMWFIFANSTNLLSAPYVAFSGRSIRKIFEESRNLMRYAGKDTSVSF
jgi:hypothetical protein